MKELGTAQNPVRIGIIGSGPAGFYAADFLLKAPELVVHVDMFDRLVTPFGLVRFGVAPDHPKIKSVTKIFDRVARKPEFRFFGNVMLGHHINVPELADFYHALIYASGAQTDRNLPIPGIDLANSHTATEFVAWYNGHPDFRDLKFDLSQENVAVIGMGNVAVDVARILAHSYGHLAKTDIADHALEALKESRVRNIYILGRRGPAQAAFTVPEARELGRLEECQAMVQPSEIQLDPLSQAEAAQSDDRTLVTKLEIINSFANQPNQGKPKLLTIRFLVSPTELIADAEGRVAKMKLSRNELYADDDGNLRSRSTDEHEELDIGLVFRSIGYYGVPLPYVPFRADWGIIPNNAGRVVDVDTGRQIEGHYVVGWIKRGPSGVIGTNRPDARETVDKLLADVKETKHLHPVRIQPEQVVMELRSRQPDLVTYEDWLYLDAEEIRRGAAQGRPRVKFTSSAEMLAVLNSRQSSEDRADET